MNIPESVSPLPEGLLRRVLASGALALTATLATTALQSAEAAIPTDTEPAIAAHRGDTIGFNVGHTEDTMGTFKATIRLARAQHRKHGTPLSKYYEECDVHATAEVNQPGKALVVLHDENLARTTDGRGNVKNLTFKQIEKYHTDLTKKHDKVPSFAQVARLVGKSGLSFLPEIKDAHASKKSIADMVAIIRRNGLEDRTIVQSFYAADLRKLHAVDPSMQSAYLRNAPTGSRTIKATGAEWVFYNQAKVTAAAIRAAHKAGLKVAAWTPSTDRQFAWDAKRSVDMIITNDAARLARQEAE